MEHSNDLSFRQAEAISWRGCPWARKLVPRRVMWKILPSMAASGNGPSSACTLTGAEEGDAPSADQVTSSDPTDGFCIGS